MRKPEKSVQLIDYIEGCLVSGEFRQKQIDLANRMTYIELSTDPNYMDQYTGAMFLPHTDPKRFPAVTEMVNSRK